MFLSHQHAPAERVPVFAARLASPTWVFCSETRRFELATIVPDVTGHVLGEVVVGRSGRPARDVIFIRSVRTESPRCDRTSPLDVVLIARGFHVVFPRARTTAFRNNDDDNNAQRLLRRYSPAAQLIRRLTFRGDLKFANDKSAPCTHGGVLAARQNPAAAALS